MRYLSVLISLLLCVNAWAQAPDSIAINNNRSQLDATYVVNANTIFAYAKQIAMGDLGEATSESVQSFLSRTKIQGEYSHDGTTYRVGYLAGDTHVRIRSRTEDDWIVIPLSDATVPNTPNTCLLYTSPSPRD